MDKDVKDTAYELYTGAVASKANLERGNVDYNRYRASGYPIVCRYVKNESINGNFLNPVISYCTN